MVQQLTGGQKVTPGQGREPDVYDSVGFTPSLFGLNKFTVEAKTGNYTLQQADSGKMLTNRGAGVAIIITLPATGILGGFYVLVYVIANATVAVTTASLDTLITFNDALADSVAYSTVGEKIGGCFLVFYDGTAWAVAALRYLNQTVTITT